MDTKVLWAEERGPKELGSDVERQLVEVSVEESVEESEEESDSGVVVQYLGDVLKNMRGADDDHHRQSRCRRSPCSSS